MDKLAKWIWSNKAESRNSWRCFRKKFNLENPPQEGVIFITADSRYTLFINGNRMGNGPMKYFQSRIPYDTYDITRHLKKGENVIGVLVSHNGIATMQHQYGEAGLLLSARFKTANEDINIVSDSSFKEARCNALSNTSPRISVQQGFTEHIDLNLWEDFSTVDFDDSKWDNAITYERKCDVYERDIPKLTNELIYPKSVCRLRAVSPPQISYVIDTRDLLLDKDSHKNCDPAHVEGFLVTNLLMHQSGEITLYFDVSRCYPVFIGNRWYNKDSLNSKKFPYIELNLPKGKHKVVFDLSAREHWMGVHFAAHSDLPFEFARPSEFGKFSEHDSSNSSPFIILGPFTPARYNPNDVPVPFDKLTHNKEREDYLFAKENMAKQGIIENLKSYAKDVPPHLVSCCDPFLLHASYRETIPELYTDYAVPCEMQSISLADNEFYELPKFENRDTEITLDFGRETVGYLQFEVDAAEGTILDFYGYEYTEKGEIQHTWGLDPVWRVVCKNGVQSFTSLIRRGFRYCSVTARNRNLTKPVRIKAINALQSTYPLARIGSFSCSDRLLTDIWEISAHTVQMCSEDTFVDCPAYEQVFWVGDSRNEALVSQYVYGNEKLIKRCLELVPLSADMNPLLTSHLPSAWNSVIPNWTFTWMIACAEHYEYTGDLEFAKGIYPAISKAISAYLEKLTEDGLLYIEAWNLLDWAPADQPNRGIVTHQNMIMAKALNSVAVLARVSGDNPTFYIKKSEALKTAINNHLWSSDSGAYIDCIHANEERSKVLSIQTQICALLCNICENDERAERVSSLLLNPPDNFVQVCSPFMSFFYYEVLEKRNHNAFILDDIRKHFGNMIKHGASTCWEQYPESPLNKIYEGMLSRSHCHAWSAGPAYFLSRIILGVKPKDLAWKSIEISPDPINLKWAKGAVPLPYSGVVEVEYEVTDDEIFIDVSLPEGIDIEIKLPEQYTVNAKIKRIKVI